MVYVPGMVSKHVMYMYICMCGAVVLAVLEILW